MCVIKAELLALCQDYGGYITYVFRNLEVNNNNEFLKYVMVTRFPNWQAPILQIGDRGFLEYQEIIAGKDTWWDSENQSFIPYKYDNVIFKNFVFEVSQENLTVML